MDFALILPPDGPRGMRLVEALREAIHSGRLGSNQRLPPTRTLAAQLNISRGTVVEAYEELISEGYCAARVGAGTFVTVVSPPHREAPKATAPRLSAWGARLPAFWPAQDDGGPARSAVRFDFRPGLAPDTFPAAALGKALRRAAERLGTEYSIGDPAGSPRLRRALAAYLGRARAVRADAAQVIVVSGTQQALDLATRLLLDPGDPVCVEDPGYPRALGIFKALGARLLPVPVGRDGMEVAALPAAGARLVYVTPSHQYPTGAVLSPERRLQLLDWAAEHDSWVLEDDYDSEFRYSGSPLPALQGLDRADRCLYLSSLSKLLHPALRAGYLVVPPALIASATAAKSTLDQATTPLVQEALADLFESGEIERHLHQVSRGYRARRARMLAAFAAHLPSHVHAWPVTGGLHAFLEVIREVSGPASSTAEVADAAAAAIVARARARGVALTDASAYYQAPPTVVPLVLWFSHIAPELIEPGVAALAAAIGGPPEHQA